MGNAEKAVLLSLAVHGLLAAGIALCLSFRSGPPETAQLDVSTVELSLADDETESVSASARPPSPPSAKELPSASPAEEPAPETARKVDAAPSEPAGISPPLAGEPAVEMNFVPGPPPSGPSRPSEEPSERGSNQARVDAPAKPITTIRPVYPSGSRRRGEQGLVTLALDIDAFGMVTKASIKISSGFRALDAAALKAVRSAKFIPARRGDEAVESAVVLPLVFKLK